MKGTFENQGCFQSEQAWREYSLVTWQSLSVHQKANFLILDDSKGTPQSMSPTSHPTPLVCASADQRPRGPESGQKRYPREEYQNSNIQHHFCHVLPSLQLPEMDIFFTSKKASQCSSLAFPIST